MPTRPPDRAALIAVLAIAAVAAFTAGPVLPAFLPIGDYAAYTAATPRALVLLEPVLHAPWFGVAPAAPALALAMLVALWQASRGLGAGAAGTATAALAWIARPDIGTPWAAGAPAPMAVALTWASLWLMAPREQAQDRAAASGWRRRVRPLVGVCAFAAACVWWPPVVVLLPVVVVCGAGAGWGVGLAVVGAAAAGVFGGLHVWAWRASALAGEAVSWRDAWAVATWSEPRGQDPFPWLPMAASTMPIGFAIVGGVVTLGTTRRRLAVAAGVVATVVVALLPHPWRLETGRALYWAAWPLVAAAFGWVIGQAAPRWRGLAAAGLGLVLVGGGVSARVRLVETLEPRLFAAVLTSALEPLVASGAVLVAEDIRVDTALVAWSGGRQLSRIRQEPSLVDAALAAGRSVLAGPSSRTALELWGYRFSPGAAVTRPTRFQMDVIRDRLRCVPVSARWNELAGLEYSGRLGVHLPRGASRLEVVVAGAAPLLVKATFGDGRAVGTITSETGTTLSRLPPVLWPGDGRLPDADAVMTRVELPAHADYDIDAAVSLGGRAPLVGARLIGDGAAATVCAAPLPRLDPLALVAADDPSGPAAVAVDDEAYFAGGWHQAEGAGAAAFRWTSGRAVLLVPSLRAQPVTLTLAARAAAPDARLRVTVNGVALDERRLTGATQDVTWPLPATVWLDGTNEIVLDVTRTVRPSDTGGQDPRQLGVAVSAIRLAIAQP